MLVTINGKQEDVPASCSVAEVLTRRQMNAQRTVVERNREIVPRERFGDTRLEEGDELELVRFVGGG